VPHEILAQRDTNEVTVGALVGAQLDHEPATVHKEPLAGYVTRVV
jgi:hypothetical protein